MAEFTPPAYYRPYESEDEEEKEHQHLTSNIRKGVDSYEGYTDESGDESGDESSGDESDTSSLERDPSARGLDDPRYAILTLSGPSFPTTTDQLFYEDIRHGGGSAYTAYDTSSNVMTIANTVASNSAATRSPLYMNPKRQIQSSLFSFKSENRDLKVFPLSSFFTLKTPRPYKNVAQIQIVQISFKYFSNAVPDLSNITAQILIYLSSQGQDLSDCLACFAHSTSVDGISFSEAGRTNPVNPSQALVHGTPIRPGNYDGPGLAAEFDKQTNKTPPFRIVTYAEHKLQFHATKTLTHLFNAPGRWIYDRQSGIFSNNATVQDVAAKYFPHITLINSSQPTDQETFVAYFYPVLVEALKDPFASRFLYLDLLDLADVKTRVVDHYEGLQSTLYYTLCVSNLAYLQKFRDSHTFKYYPIHDYRWSYNPYTNKIGVVHTDLHPSLTADLQSTYQSKFQQAIAAAQLLPTQFAALKLQQSHLCSVVADLGASLGTALTQVGVQYAHPIDYFTQPSHYVSTTGTIQGPLTDDVLLAAASGSVTAPAPPGGLGARSPPYAAGWTTLADLVAESQPSTLANPALYDPLYRAQLLSLNTASVVTGAGYAYTAGQTGAPVQCVDFPSLYSTFQSYASTNTGISATVTDIYSSTLSSTTQYVSSHYGQVFPPAMLANNSYLSNKGPGGVMLYTQQRLIKPSTPFDLASSNVSANYATPCCAYIDAVLDNVYSCFPAEYIASAAIFQKAGFVGSNILNYYSTLASAGAVTKNNLYLQLNVEQGLNNMDVAAKENYNITNETTGEHKVVLGKILTEGSGLQDVTQTVVQLPAKFDTPLSTIDHFSFNLLLDTLTPLSRIFPFQLAGSDWDGILQIDEEVGALDRDTDLAPVPTIAWSNKPF